MTSVKINTKQIKMSEMFDHLKGMTFRQKSLSVLNESQYWH